LGHNLAVIRIVDVSPARELVTALPVLSPALAIALARDGRVAAAWLADFTSGQHQVDARQAVLSPLRAMLDPTSVYKQGCRRCAPPRRRLHQRGHRYRGDLCHTLGGIAGDALAHIVKTLGVLCNEVVIDPAPRHADVQQAVHERAVAPG